MMGSLRALAIVMTLAPALVLAQPTAAEKQKASDLVKKAIKKSQDGDHETAVELYQQAYKIIPQPLLLSNIGSEFQQMKKNVEARTYFCRYIEADPNGNNVSYATAQAKILYLELSGASSVDDKDVCKPIVKAPPPKQEPLATSVEPTPTTPEEPTDTPKKKTNVLRYAGIGVAVVGAGLFGVGTYYGLEAKSVSDFITNHPTDEAWPADIKEREAKGEDAEKKQIAFMVTGGLVLAAGVVMVIVSAPKEEKDTSVTFTPVATPDTVGFAAAGRF